MIFSGTSATRSKISAALLLVLAFLLGGIAGAISFYLYRNHIHQANRRPSVIEDVTRAVGLDAAQQEMLRAIINKRVERYRAFDEIMRQETRTQVQQILRPDQNPRYEQLIRKWEEQRLAWEKHQQQEKKNNP